MHLNTPRWLLHQLHRNLSKAQMVVETVFPTPIKAVSLRMIGRRFKELVATNGRARRKQVQGSRVVMGRTTMDRATKKKNMKKRVIMKT